MEFSFRYPDFKHGVSSGIPGFPDGHSGDSGDFPYREQAGTGAFPDTPLENTLFQPGGNSRSVVFKTVCMDSDLKIYP